MSNVREKTNEELAYTVESIAMGKRAMVSGVSPYGNHPSRVTVEQEAADALDEAARRLRDQEP